MRVPVQWLSSGVAGTRGGPHEGPSSWDCLLASSLAQLRGVRTKREESLGEECKKAKEGQLAFTSPRRQKEMFHGLTIVLADVQNMLEGRFAGGEAETTRQMEPVA